MAGKPRIIIDSNKIYNSNECGPFQIIEDLGRDSRSRLFVKVRFINTGTEKVVRYDIAMAGKVVDDLYGIDFNKIYNSYYYGPYKIISFDGRNKSSRKIVTIEFLNTGYRYQTSLRVAVSGNVKDYSIGFHDRVFNPPKDQYNKMIDDILKGRWKAMMDRCYNKSSNSYYKYGAIGVKVDDYWHNIDNFLYSVHYVKNFCKFYHDPLNYQMDKDLLQQNVPRNKRIYSIHTCIFLSSVDNSNLSVIDRHDGSYYGIKEIAKGKYQVAFSVDGKVTNFGTYSNLDAAINEYNYYYCIFVKFEFVPLLNRVNTFMTHEEAQQFLIKSNTK